jgi:cytoskeleton protein RodZ
MEEYIENLGAWLRAAREDRGLSLKEVEASTRIRIRYLEALEAEDFGALPGGEAQVRGFLRRYATFLDLSPDEAVTRYQQRVHGSRTDTAPATPAPRVATPLARALSSGPGVRRLRIAALAAAALVVVALVAVGVWQLLDRSSPAGPQEESLAPPAADEPLSPLATAADAAAAAQSPEATATFPVAASGGVTLTLEPLEHTWVRVTVDGFTAFEGMLSPGIPITRTAEEMVAVETGNGAGLVAVVNGQVQGALGGRGELVARCWGPEGEMEIPLPPVATPVPEEEP